MSIFYEIEFAKYILPYPGKTRAFGSMPYLRWDHPRSCGKDFYQVHRRLGEWGSPPLVRERLQHRQLSYLKVRITPARAGKTISRIRER